MAAKHCKRDKLSHGYLAVVFSLVVLIFGAPLVAPRMKDEGSVLHHSALSDQAFIVTSIARDVYGKVGTDKNLASHASEAI